MTHGQLIETIAHSQPENPFLPENSESMSPEELYPRIQKRMKKQGIHVLEGKNINSSISNLEFLNIVYTFSGGPRAKDLISQKLYLKEKGFISSTDIGLATEIKGSVVQYHENSTFAKPVTLATPLFQFDQIQTERKSRAAFTFDDKSRMILSGSTNLSIDKNIYDPNDRFRQMLFRVSKGSAHFVVSKAMKKGSTFTVITPNGVAGVRGTEFITVVEPDGETRFVVLEGEIETAPRLSGGKWGKRAFIRTGEMQTLYKNGQASRVKKAPQRLLDKLQKNRLDHDKIKHPEILRKAKRQINKSKSHTKNRIAKTSTTQDKKQLNRDDLKPILANTTNAMSHGIDREALRALKNISQPSPLDRFKSQYQSSLTYQTLEKLKQTTLIHQ